MILPTVEEVRAWAGVNTASMPDAMLAPVLAAELAIQAQICWLDDVTGDDDPYPPELRQAVYRRCARQIAARNLPLGLVDTSGETGATRLPNYDAEIQRLENPRRIVAIA